MFSSNAKHLSYRYVTPILAGHSFRVNGGETWYFFFQIAVVHIDFCLISNIFSCTCASITLRMKLLRLMSSSILKFDVKSEDIDCEKTELSGITGTSVGEHRKIFASMEKWA